MPGAVAGLGLMALTLLGCGGPSAPVSASTAPAAAAATTCAPSDCGPGRCCLTPGTPGTLHFSAACTRRACPPGECCNSCGAGVEFRPDGWPPRRAVALSNHGCVADGCGALTGCRVAEGPYTLPDGLKVMPDGSLRLPD